MNTILEHAIKNNDLELVKKLLENGKIPYSERYLSWSSRQGNIEIVKLFLLYKKSCLTVDCLVCSENALDHAALEGHYEIVKLLLEHKKPCSERAINQAAKFGYYKIVKLLHIYEKPYSEKYKLLIEEIAKHDFS